MILDWLGWLDMFIEGELQKLKLKNLKRLTMYCYLNFGMTLIWAKLLVYWYFCFIKWNCFINLFNVEVKIINYVETLVTASNSLISDFNGEVPDLHPCAKDCSELTAMILTMLIMNRWLIVSKGMYVVWVVIAKTNWIHYCVGLVIRFKSETKLLLLLLRLNLVLKPVYF